MLAELGFLAMNPNHSSDSEALGQPLPSPRTPSKPPLVSIARGSSRVPEGADVSVGPVDGDGLAGAVVGVPTDDVACVGEPPMVESFPDLEPLTPLLPLAAQPLIITTAAAHATTRFTE